MPRKPSRTAKKLSLEKNGQIIGILVCDGFCDCKMFTFGRVVRHIKLTLACCYVWLLHRKEFNKRGEAGKNL